MNFFHFVSNFTAQITNRDYYILLILILLTIAFFIFVSSKKNSKNNFLDKVSTNQIKGLAVISIIVYHYLTAVIQNPHVKIAELVGQAGAMGVETFLILSGFGLIISYKEKGFEKHYLIKRFLRILIPYWIITTVWVILDYSLLHTTHSLKSLLLNFLGINLYNEYSDLNLMAWFVTFILFSYVLFYIIFKTQLSLTVKIILLLIINLSLANITKLPISPDLKFTWFWSNYAIFFPLGVLIGNNYDKLKNIYIKIPNKDLLTILLTLLIAGIIYMATIDWALGYLLNHSTLGFIPIITVLILATLRLNSYFLTFIGSISYELYLTHGPFLFRFDFILYKEPYYITFIVYFILMIILSILLKKVSDKIVYLFQRKFNF